VKKQCLSVFNINNTQIHTHYIQLFECGSVKIKDNILEDETIGGKLDNMYKEAVDVFKSMREVQKVTKSEE